MKRVIIWISIAAGATAIGTWAATTMPSGATDNSTPATQPAQQQTAASSSAATQPSAAAQATTNPSQAAAQNSNYNQRNFQGQNNQGQFNQRGNRRNRNNGINGNNGNNFSSTDPSDAFSIPPTMPMAAAYDAVSRRNLFIKGRQTLNTDPPAFAGNFNAGPRGPQPLVFDGTTLTDGELLAYIEDTATGEVRTFKPGDSVGVNGMYGKILKVNIDSIDVLQNNQTITIEGGQTMTGESAFDTLYMNNQTPAAAATPAVPTTLPTGEDIISVMKRRRMMEQQQLNGGGAAPGATGSAPGAAPATPAR